MNVQSDNSEFRNFAIVVISILALLIVGVAGYVFLEDWNWLDALYMTFITISTVGFKEVAPLHDHSRLFTIFLILFGLIVLSMLSASVTSLLVRRELIAKFKFKRMKKEIQKLRDHTILCGAGETGKTVIDEFIHARNHQPSFMATTFSLYWEIRIALKNCTAIYKQKREVWWGFRVSFWMCCETVFGLHALCVSGAECPRRQS